MQMQCYAMYVSILTLIYMSEVRVPVSLLCSPFDISPVRSDEKAEYLIISFGTVNATWKQRLELTCA